MKFVPSVCNYNKKESIMYEKLTEFLSKLDILEYGRWIFAFENDGTSEHPIHMPFVNYHCYITE